MSMKNTFQKDLTCVTIDDERHGIEQMEALIAKVPGIVKVGSFTDAKEAISFLHGHGGVDIIFSDVSMPNLNGLEAAKILKVYCQFLYFVTAYRDFAYDAFKVNVRGYLIKPVGYLDFAQEILGLKEEISQKALPLDNFIFLKGDRKHNYFKVMCDDIIYIKALLNYVQVFTEKKMYTTYSLLGEIEQKLGNRKMFIRISKSIIISLLHLEQTEGNMAFMSQGNPHPVGAPYREKLTEFLRHRLVGS